MSQGLGAVVFTFGPGRAIGLAAPGEALHPQHVFLELDRGYRGHLGAHQAQGAGLYPCQVGLVRPLQRFAAAGLLREVTGNRLPAFRQLIEHRLDIVRSPRVAALNLREAQRSAAGQQRPQRRSQDPAIA